MNTLGSFVFELCSGQTDRRSWTLNPTVIILIIQSQFSSNKFYAAVFDIWHCSHCSNQTIFTDVCFVTVTLWKVSWIVNWIALCSTAPNNLIITWEAILILSFFGLATDTYLFWQFEHCKYVNGRKNLIFGPEAEDFLYAAKFWNRPRWYPRHLVARILLFCFFVFLSLRLQL